MSAIQIQHLSFQYPLQDQPALQDISLEIPERSRFGLFGPNGAGKTTLMQILTGLIRYDQGHVTMWNEDRRLQAGELKGSFGWVPQDFAFYPELSPLENLAFFGAWYGLSGQDIRSQSEQLLNILGLERVAKKPVQQFSGGMKRRVNLAIGVIHQPRLLILDEPTVGVDIQTRNAIIAYLKALNAGGTTLLYTSHHLKEAEELCDHIALIDQGQLICSDRLDNLLLQNQEQGLEGLFLSLTGRAYRD